MTSYDSIFHQDFGFDPKRARSDRNATVGLDINGQVGIIEKRKAETCMAVECRQSTRFDPADWPPPGSYRPIDYVVLN